MFKDIKNRLISAGFSNVFILSGQECGIPEETLIIAAMAYQADSGIHETREACAVIHPYYPVSQAAYIAAKEIVEADEHLQLRPDIRVKPIFARLACMTQGRNTISYLPKIGSRFHVQIFTCDVALEPTDHLMDAPKPLHCGSCSRCFNVCPTHAIDEEGFHRDRCLRNYHLSGKVVPIEIREKMGTAMLGCDLCQSSCPHNPASGLNNAVLTPVVQILKQPAEYAGQVAPLIGYNMAIPNRILSQACIIAGNSGDFSLSSELEKYVSHPSPVVREHCQWAINRLKSIE